MRQHSKTKHHAAQQRPTNHLWLMALVAMIAMMLSYPAFAAGTYEKPKPSQAAKIHDSYRKAETFIAQDNYEAALSALAIVIKDEPKNADAWNLTGFSYRKLEQFDASKTAYETALSLNPKHERAMEYMGELYLTLGDVEQAEMMLAKLNKACSFNCKYRDMLKKAIATYKANQ